LACKTRHIGFNLRQAAGSNFRLGRPFRVQELLPAKPSFEPSLGERPGTEEAAVQMSDSE